MRSNPRITSLLDEAQSARRCAFGSNEADNRSLRLRARRGCLVMPYPRLYARVDHWNALGPFERTLHVVRALNLLHPLWVFACLTAAVVHGYDHGYDLHRDGIIHIASARSSQTRDSGRLMRIPMRDVPTVHVDGIPVTDPVRTLIDCGVRYSFREALPIFDAAARNGILVCDAQTQGVQLGLDSGRLAPLCKHASPLSENGGESTVRAIIIDSGFPTPQLQRRFSNPDNPASGYRADFCWALSQGLVVAEFDGMAKYTMPSSGERRTIQAAVHAERLREDHLRRQGVVAIVRLEFEDIVYPERLVRKLMDAGVPRFI